MHLNDQQEDKTEGLIPAQEEIIRFFVKVAAALNLPRSIGELFGYLFASENPQPFDEIVSTLGISKGSASQGLKFLVKVGAASVVYIPRDRRTFYIAETSMRQLFGSGLRETIRPHLEGNQPYFESIEELIASDKTEHDASYDYLDQRLASLKSWNDKALQLLPLLEVFFALPTPNSFLDLLKRSGKEKVPD